MTHHGIGFDHVPSGDDMPPEALDGRKLLILSDYPAARFAPGLLDRVVEQVRGGMGLLMIGGWESFTGQGGHYAPTPLAEAICVEMSAADDRVNCDQPCLMAKVADHPIIDSLPLDRPPCIGGYNRVVAKPSATVLLEVRRFAVHLTGDDCTFTPLATESDPLLVVGQFGAGRSAAFTTDAAPHWVGGLVDWGPSRVTAAAPGGSEVEVGDSYAQFLANLVRWTAGMSCA